MQKHMRVALKNETKIYRSKTVEIFLIINKNILIILMKSTSIFKRKKCFSSNTGNVNIFEDPYLAANIFICNRPGRGCAKCKLPVKK